MSINKANKENIMKLSSPTIATALILFAASFNAQAVTQYKITDLGTLGGTSSRAYGINNIGDIVGRSRPAKPDGSNDTRSGFLYTNNQMLNLGNFGGSNTVARASNFSRQVVGYSRPTDSTDYKAFLYERGQLKNLGTLGNGKLSYAYGINNNGQVVGHSHTNESGTTSQAFIYENETITGIGTLGGSSSGAFDINDQGVIVGTSTTAGPVEIQAFVYENGQMTNLGSLDGTGYSEARAINNNNQIVGNSLSESGNYHAFMYENGVMNDLGSIEGDSFAFDINMKGQVVGDYRSHLLESSGHAYVYEDGQMYDLTGLLSVSNQAKWELTSAYGINDKGQIVGWGKINGQTHAYLLTSVPIPGALPLLFSAFGLLGFFCKRNKI
jgi:probable HAF family extracellular repeat protein